MENKGRCTKCRKAATIKLKTSGDFCNRCFAEVIEKRVRKDLRLNKWINKGDNVLFIDDNSKEAKVGEYLLKSIIKGLPITFVKGKSKKYDKIIIPWNLDMEVEQKLNQIFTKIPKKQADKKEVRLLRSLLDKEIEIFAKLKKLKYKKQAKSEMQKRVDKLEEKYPGCKFSVLNSMKLVNS